METQETISKYIKALELYEDKSTVNEAVVLFHEIIKEKSYLGTHINAVCLYFLGLYYRDKNNEQALQLLKRIKRKASPKFFAYASISLFWLEEESKYLKKIKLSDDMESYAKANFLMGLLQDKVKLKNKYWSNIPSSSEIYKKENYQFSLVKAIIELENNKCEYSFYKIFEKVNHILKNSFVGSIYEEGIAHYTNLTVSKLLLSNGNAINEFNTSSLLRLNTINLMNDPQEGLLLNKLLEIDSKLNTSDLAFIACFTLHHDSLNQFRLYAKQDQKEASGVSLVINKDFFAEVHNTASIHNRIKIEKTINFEQDTSRDLTDNISIKAQILSTMPLYRCIYFDPTSGLIKVAQREEWSFYREFKLEKAHQWFDENKDADTKWKEYSKEIQIIEESVKESLKELSLLINKLSIDNLEIKERELLAEILLPLRYLMKHMAFKEEQECRIVYVTQIDNELIQYDEKINRVYIDYEQSIMEHLEKIYIAPKAKDEKMIFEYLCSRGQEVRKGKEPVKVKISQNPFR